MKSVHSRRALLLGCGALALAAPANAQPAEVPFTRPDGVRSTALIVGAPRQDAPVAVFSHGLGGSSRSLLWLAEALAPQGYVCVLPTHPETGPGAIGRVMRRAPDEPSGAAMARLVAAPKLEAARSDDIAAALALVDPDHSARFRALLGHSMGAAAAMIEAGAKTAFGSIGRDAFDAYVAISPQGPGALFPPDAWAGLRKPVLMISGTRDVAAEGGPETRLPAFAGLPPGRKRLAILPGATHFQLGGAGSAKVRASVAALAQEFLRQAETGGFSGSRVAGAQITDK